MSMIKRIFPFLNGIFLIIMGMIICTFPVSAEEIDFKDNGVLVIKNIGSISSDGYFKLQDHVKLPDSIVVNGVVMTYKDHNRSDLCITLSDNGRVIFKKEVKESLIESEINKSGGLVLYTNKIYIITHGNEKWILNFTETSSAVEKTGASVGKDAEAVIDSEKEEEDDDDTGWSWWQWVLIVLGVIVLAFAILFFIAILYGYYKKGGKQGKGAKPQENEGTKIEGSISAEKPGEEEKNASTETIEVKIPDEKGVTENEVADDAKVETAEDVLSRLLSSGNEGGCSVKEKEKFIASQLEEAKGMLLLRKVLELSDKASADEMVEKIKSLMQCGKAPSEEETQKSLEKMFESLVLKMEKANNKEVKRAVTRLLDESQGSKTPFYDTLRKFIDDLPIFIRNLSISKQDVEFNIEITEAQMNAPENRRRMMAWTIKQLEDRGFKELNRNSTVDANFGKLADLLNAATVKKEEYSENEIVNSVIMNNRFTDVQRKILLDRFIEKLNAQISTESSKISLSESFEDLINLIAAKMQEPSSYEEAVNIVRSNDLKAVNEVMESNLTDFNRESLINALRNVIVADLNKRLKDFRAESYDEAYNLLSRLLVEQKRTEGLMKDYNVASVGDLPSAIRNSQFTDLLKSVNEKVERLLPGTQVDSAQKLVNALMKLADDAIGTKDLIADELEEKISLRDKSFVSTGDKDILGLFSKYENLVSAKENELSDRIALQNDEILKLTDEVSRNGAEVAKLTAKNSNLMYESVALVDKLHAGADRILDACKTILNPCSDNEESQCVDIEDRLFGELSNIVNRLKAFCVDKTVIPADARKLIQRLLIDEFSGENSPINTVCRYYAYSRLPFMTDSSREYGITFNRKNMSELFDSIDTLYVQFGINFNIPNLFVMGIDEGNFENLTGKMYGDLDNLCQNSRNHFDNIDSNAKPANVIVDIVGIGFSVDGKIEKVTSVLTY